jgi:hypothetical protein
MISLICSASSCGGDDAEICSVPDEPTIEELEAKVVENCCIVRDALEAYRSHNDGACPVDIYTETNDLGLTLIDLLPEGQLLENPFTGERTEPTDTIATEPGQTGYWLNSPAWRYPFFYHINGVGESTVVVELSNQKELETKAIQNCLIVREAVERWADLSGGVYPDNVGVDTTPEGHTVTSLLPGGCLLENPFTGCATEPMDCTAAHCGEVGYMPLVRDLQNVGYTISGVGGIICVTIFIGTSAPEGDLVLLYDELFYCSGAICNE